MIARKKLVDAMCADLAKHFLGEFKYATAIDETELAEAIQDICEDFCAGMERECICRMETVNTASIDPPEMIVNRDCPVHGSPRDPDAEYERQRDERGA